jgi:hypothetical protein
MGSTRYFVVRGALVNMRAYPLARVQAIGGRVWSAALVVSGVALVVWATIVLSAQAVYWVKTGVWVPINVFHAAFLNAAVTAGQPLVVTLVSIENGLARLVLSLPSIEFKQAIIGALDAVPFAASLYGTGGILLYLSREGTMYERTVAARRTLRA